MLSGRTCVCRELVVRGAWYCRAGLSDVIGLDWLRMFSSNELSTLISGAEHEISVTDLQAHTNYSGGYDVNHPTISAFWQVVSGMSPVALPLLIRLFRL